MSGQPPLSGVAYKVLTGAEMAQFRADGHFAGSPVDLADGYIHLSTAAQLTATVDKHFAGPEDIAPPLMVAAIELAPLGDAVRWEPARGGALFPHVYAPLPWSAVCAFEPLWREADGSVALPA